MTPSACSRNLLAWRHSPPAYPLVCKVVSPFGETVTSIMRCIRTSSEWNGFFLDRLHLRSLQVLPDSGQQKCRSFKLIEMDKGLIEAILKERGFGQVVMNAVLIFFVGDFHLVQFEVG